MKNLFLEAIDLPLPERSVFLFELESHDSRLPRQLWDLLAAHERAHAASEAARRSL